MTQRFANVFLLDNPKRVQAAAVNLAAREFGAGVEFLLRLDAHAEYPDDYAVTLIEEAIRTRAESVVVSMKTRGVGWFQRAVAAAQNSKLGTGGASHRMSVSEGRWTDHGHHALMRIDAFRNIGGYDESFSHNEDAELDFRLRQAGMRIWLTSKTFMTHYPRTSPVALFRQYVSYGAGRARTAIKHRARLRLRQMAPIAVVPITLLAAASPWNWIVAIPVTIWALGCVAYGTVLAIKSRDGALIASGAAAIIMHFGWSLGFWRTACTTLGRSRASA
jgi:succinoglycan biosynthesis protein ExoA